MTHGDALHAVAPAEDEAATAVDDADVITHSVAHGNPAHRGGSGFRVPREARVGVAITLSFALLVTVMLLNRGGKGKTPPVNEIAGKSKSGAKQAENSGEKAVLTETEQDPSAAQAKDAPATDATPEKAQEPAGGGTADAVAAVPPPAPATAPAKDDTTGTSSVPPPAVTATPPVADATAAKDPSLAAVPLPASGEKPDSDAALAPGIPPETSNATLAPALPPVGANDSQPPAAVASGPPTVGGEASPATVVPPPVTAATPAAEPPPTAPIPALAAEAAASSPAPTPALVVEPPASVAPAEAAAPAFPPAGSTADSAAPPPASPDTRSGLGAMPGEPGAPVGATTPIAPPSELPNVAAETSPMVPDPVTRAQGPGAGAAAEAAAVVPMSTAGAAREGWVKLPNTRFRQEQDDRVAARTTPAERPSDHADGPPVRDSAERIEAIPHIVQPGENFWTISRLYYRSGRYYKALWKANQDKAARPADLVVGMTIRVPPHEALDPALVDPPAPERVERANGSSVPLRRTSRPVLNGSAPDRSTVRRPVSDERLTLPAHDAFDDPPPRSRASRHAVAVPTDDEEEGEEETNRPRRPRYRVRSRHETVRSIAKATLGDAHREDEILRLNRKVIQDPYHLTPGQYLELPEDARIGGLGR